MGGLCQHLEVEALRLQLSQWEGAAWRHALADPSEASERAIAVVSSGCSALDRILPEHGFRPGTLVEWLTSAPGDGAATLAFRVAVEALGDSKGIVPFSPPRCAGAPRKSEQSPDGCAVVVVDASGEFYPPAAIALGIEPSRLIVVHPNSPADHTWALDQAMRCPAVAAAVAWPDRTHHAPRDACKPKLDGRAFRRLQLAAEQGGGLGLLIRPAAVRGEPSWADVRLLVEPLPSTREVGRRRIRIVLLRSRGGFGERAVEVEVDDEPHPLYQAR
jgi:hypothetical protein